MPKVRFQRISVTRLLLTAVCAGLLCAGPSSCGSTSPRTRGRGAEHGSTTAASASPHRPISSRPDTDGDNDHNYDEGLTGEGTKVVGSQLATIAATVRRYYAFSAAGNGARACLLLAPTLAKTVALDHSTFGDPRLHGKTCPVVLSEMQREMHRQLAADSVAMKVIEVRSDGAHAFALLRTQSSPHAKIRLQREGDSWRIGSLFAGE